jgi:hypothetical protein
VSQLNASSNGISVSPLEAALVPFRVTQSLFYIYAVF